MIMQSEDNNIVKPINAFYLMGLRTDAMSETPNFFTFLLEQDGILVPLIKEGRLALFMRPEQAEEALKNTGIEVTFKESPGVSNTYLLDAAYALHLVAHGKIDPDKVIANLLDWFARTLTALGVPLPPVFDVLVDLGHFADQNPFIADFLDQEPFRRQRVIDGIRWCLGAILSLSSAVAPMQD